MLSDECKWDSTSMHKLYPPKPLHTHLQNLVSMNNPASACKDVFFFFEWMSETVESSKAKLS